MTSAGVPYEEVGTSVVYWDDILNKPDFTNLNNAVDWTINQVDDTNIGIPKC